MQRVYCSIARTYFACWRLDGVRLHNARAIIAYDVTDVFCHILFAKTNHVIVKVAATTHNLFGTPIVPIRNKLATV
jgi:hypothetical protein